MGLMGLYREKEMFLFWWGMFGFGSFGFIVGKWGWRPGEDGVGAKEN